MNFFLLTERQQKINGILTSLIFIQGLTWISKQEDWKDPSRSVSGAEYCELQWKDPQAANLYQKEDCAQNHVSKYVEEEGKDYEDV